MIYVLIVLTIIILIIMYNKQLIFKNSSNNKYRNNINSYDLDCNKYFKFILDNYGLKLINTHSKNVIFVKDNFAIIIRYSPSPWIEYVYRDINNELMKINCHLYFAEKTIIELSGDILIKISDNERDAELEKMNDNDLDCQYEILKDYNKYNSKKYVDETNIDPEEIEVMKNLKTIDTLLETSWKIVLEGSELWIDDYNKSIWYYEPETLEIEIANILNKYI